MVLVERERNVICKGRGTIFSCREGVTIRIPAIYTSHITTTCRPYIQTNVINNAPFYLILYNIKDEVAWKSLDIFLLTQMQHSLSDLLGSQAIDRSNLSATVMNNV